MTPILFSLSILTPLLFGFLTARLLIADVRFPLLGKIAIGWGLGLGLTGIYMFLLGALKIDYSQLVLLPLLCMVIYLGINFRRTTPLHMPKADRIQVFDPLFIVLTSYVSLMYIYIFAMAMLFPVISWDAIATIAFQAKIIFFDKGLYHLTTSPKPYYPLFVPLSEVWISTVIGHWDDQLIKVIFPLLSLSFSMIFYYYLLSVTTRRWAMFGCALLLSAHKFVLFSMIAYMDLFAMYYTCASVLLLLLWYRQRSLGLLFIAGAFAGFTAYSKVEGALYLGLICLFMLFMLIKYFRSIRDFIQSGIAFLTPALVTFAFIQIHRMANGIQYNKRAKLFLDTSVISKFTDFLNNLFKALFLSGDWNILILLFIMSLVTLRKPDTRPETKMVFLLVAMFFGLLTALATFTGSSMWLGGEVWYQVLPRLLLHFFPLTPLFIILAQSPSKNGQVR